MAITQTRWHELVVASENDVFTDVYGSIHTVALPEVSACRRALTGPRADPLAPARACGRCTEAIIQARNSIRREKIRAALRRFFRR